MLAASIFQSSNFNLREAITAMGFSLIASVAVYLVYRLFYASRNIGAGVDRSFIVAGPAITALFLGIQSSIPLSLGLLGALSFVRFRTPVKDPAEIGYLLLLIAMSIGAATRNYMISIILFIVIFLTLVIQRLIQNRFSFHSPTNLMISVDKNLFPDVEPELTKFLTTRVSDLTMKTMSVLDDRVSIHYQHKRIPSAGRAEFISDLTKFGEPGKIDFFAG